MWMYQNGGGDLIQRKMVSKLLDRGIEAITGLNLRHAVVKNEKILLNNTLINELDLFFSYNAGEQTQYQVYLYKIVNTLMPMINSYESFAISEDKFQTTFMLKNKGIPTTDFELCHRDDTQNLRSIINRWKKMVYKPVDGWGGVGLTKNGT